MSAFGEYLASLGFPLWLRLGDVSGTTALNSGVLGATGNGNIVNAPTLAVPGAILADGNASMSFAASSSQRIQVAHHASLAGPVISFGGWFRRLGTPAGTEVLIRKSDGATFNFVGFLRNDGALVVGCSAGGGAVKATPGNGINPVQVCDGRWHSFGCVIAGDVRHYVDGQLITTRSLDGAAVDTGTGDVQLASTGAATYLTGGLDEMWIVKGIVDDRIMWNIHALGAFGRLRRTNRPGRRYPTLERFERGGLPCCSG